MSAFYQYLIDHESFIVNRNTVQLDKAAVLLTKFLADMEDKRSYRLHREICSYAGVDAREWDDLQSARFLMNAIIEARKGTEQEVLPEKSGSLRKACQRWLTPSGDIYLSRENAILLCFVLKKESVEEANLFLNTVLEHPVLNKRSAEDVIAMYCLSNHMPYREYLALCNAWHDRTEQALTPRDMAEMALRRTTTVLHTMEQQEYGMDSADFLDLLSNRALELFGLYRARKDQYEKNKKWLTEYLCADIMSTRYKEYQKNYSPWSEEQDARFPDPVRLATMVWQRAASKTAAKEVLEIDYASFLDGYRNGVKGHLREEDLFDVLFGTRHVDLFNQILYATPSPILEKDDWKQAKCVQAIEQYFFREDSKRGPAAHMVKDMDALEKNMALTRYDQSKNGSLSQERNMLLLFSFENFSYNKKINPPLYSEKAMDSNDFRMKMDQLLQRCGYWGLYENNRMDALYLACLEFTDYCRKTGRTVIDVKYDPDSLEERAIEVISPATELLKRALCFSHRAGKAG